MKIKEHSGLAAGEFFAKPPRAQSRIAAETAAASSRRGGIFVEHIDGESGDYYSLIQCIKLKYNRKIVEHMASLVPRVTVKGNMYPLRAAFGTVGGVNRKLTDEQIAATFEALRRTGGAVSGRGLRAALRRQFGAAGKTDRVFALCRALQTPGVDEIAELHRRLEEAERGRAAAESARDQALERAVRAEAREMAHQDRWANEIYTLRQRVRQLRGEGERRPLFQPNVHRVGEAPAGRPDGIESARVDSGRDRLK